MALIERRDDIECVIVKFKDGTELLATPEHGFYRQNTNCDQEGANPRYEWNEWEVRWTDSPNL